MSLGSSLPTPIRRMIVSMLPRGPRRIGLIGFYGWGNYGDELFIDAFSPALNRAGTMKVLPEIPHDPYYSRPVRDVVREQDAIVIGGGDLVQPSRRNLLYWHPGNLERPVFIYGVGVPISASIDVKPHIVARLRSFFQNPMVKYVGVRDQASKDWIDAELSPSVEVRVHPDLVCSIDLPAATRPEGPPILGIVTRQRPVDTPDDYSAVERLARTAQDRGMRVRHIVLGTGIVGQRDLANTDDLNVPGKELVHSENLDDLSRWIGECRVLASMKFHGTVVATMYGTPSICMMPTSKNRNFLTDIGRPELIRQFAQPDLHEALEGGMPDLVSTETITDLKTRAKSGLDELVEAITHHTKAPARRRSAS